MKIIPVWGLIKYALTTVLIDIVTVTKQALPLAAAAACY